MLHFERMFGCPVRFLRKDHRDGFNALCRIQPLFSVVDSILKKVGKDTTDQQPDNPTNYVGPLIGAHKLSNACCCCCCCCCCTCFVIALSVLAVVLVLLAAAVDDFVLVIVCCRRCFHCYWFCYCSSCRCWCCWFFLIVPEILVWKKGSDNSFQKKALGAL